MKKIKMRKEIRMKQIWIKINFLILREKVELISALIKCIQIHRTIPFKKIWIRNKVKKQKMNKKKQKKKRRKINNRKQERIKKKIKINRI